MKRVCLAVLALTAPALLAACDPVTLAGGAGAGVGTAAASDGGVDAAANDAKIRIEINDLWFRQSVELYRDVSLTISEGRVELTGSVKKPETRVEAVRLAWQAAGVKQVIDDIQVTDQSGISDYASDVWIANDLRTRLMFDKQIKNINYTVDVVNGTVYLMGVARDQAELDRVIAHARDIDGVQRVVNNVVLRNDPRRTGSN